MRELALVESVIDMIAEHAGLPGPTRQARNRQTHLRRTHAIRFYFDVSAAETPLDGARLEIVEIEARQMPRLWRNICAGDALGLLPMRERRIASGCRGDELRVKKYELDTDATV